MLKIICIVFKIKYNKKICHCHFLILVTFKKSILTILDYEVNKDKNFYENPKSRTKLLNELKKCLRNYDTNKI